MPSSPMEFRFRFRPEFIAGSLIALIFASSIFAELYVGDKKFDVRSPIMFLFFGGAGLFYLSPAFLVKCVSVDDEWITFKPLNYRYPIRRIKWIKDVQKDGDKILFVRMVTEGTPNIWLPCVLIGNNEVAKLSLRGTDGQAFLKCVEGHIQANASEAAVPEA